MADNQPDYNWPAPEKRSLIGKRISRVDGPFKVSGRAKYTYDYNPKGMLYGAVLRSPHPKARIVSIDTSEAEKMPGVKAVHIIQKDPSGKPVTIQFAGGTTVSFMRSVMTEDYVPRVEQSEFTFPYTEQPRYRFFDFGHITGFYRNSVQDISPREFMR